VSDEIDDLTGFGTLEYATRRLHKMVVSGDVPPVLIAHYAIGCVMPKLAVHCGVKHFQAGLSLFLSRYLCRETGTCMACSKNPATVEDICSECNAEIESSIAN